MIPLVDLVAQYHEIQAEVDAAMHEVLENGHFILGPSCRAFEEEVGAYLGVKHCIGVASGTDALVIALRAAGVGPGDEVIVPAYSFFATAGAALLVGAKPVFVDICPGTFCLDLAQVEEQITPRTRAVIPVHLYGHPAEMDQLLEIANRSGIKVLEDNAQAFGAEYRGAKTGSMGDIGCLSFFPTKNLGGFGDGGMVVTNQDDLAERMRLLRVHGWRKKYFPELLGYNSRLDELQAAILRIKLKYVDAWNRRRAEIAHCYTGELKDLEGVVTPAAPRDGRHVYHLYTLRLDRRELVKSGLKQAGIASDVYYPLPLHLTEPCRKLGYHEGDFPVAERACREALSIPLYPEMGESRIHSVIEGLRATVKASSG